MITKKKIITKETEVYIAQDGREFNFSTHCEIYEKYMGCTIFDILKDYITIFDEKVGLEMKKNIIPDYAFIKVNKRIPQEIVTYISFIEQEPKMSIPNFTEFESEEPCLYYKKWNSTFENTYRKNCWERIGTKKEVLKKIAYYKNKLFAFDN